MSSAITRTEAVDGWILSFASKDSDGEPLFRDLDIAERAGLADPHDVRRAIATAIKNGEIAIPGSARNQESSCFAVVVSETIKAGATSRVVNSYYLDEEATLEILMRLKTPLARALRKDVRRVYLAWRRGHLTPAATPPATSIINALAACNLTVGDNSGAAADLKNKLSLYARSARISFQRAHGRLKRDFRVPSYRYLSLIHYPLAREQLIALAEHPDMAPALAASAATNQLNLFASLTKKDAA